MTKRKDAFYLLLRCCGFSANLELPYCEDTSAESEDLRVAEERGRKRNETTSHLVFEASENYRSVVVFFAGGLAAKGN